MKISRTDVSTILNRIPNSLRNKARLERREIIKSSKEDFGTKVFNVDFGQYDFWHNINLKNKIQEILANLKTESFGTKGISPYYPTGFIAKHNRCTADVVKATMYLG